MPPSCIVETPPSLAQALVQAIRLPNARWLDPCVGDGVFPKAIVQKCTDSTILAIDCRESEHATSVCEFLKADFLSIDRERAEADIIVANPPFVPVGRLSDDLRTMALRAKHLDLRVAGSSSYWLPFLLHSLALLSEGGNIGFILPASYEYADYAKDARVQIPKLFRRFVVHRSLTPLFPSVSDGCIVVLGFGFTKRHVSEQRYEHQDLASLLKALKVKPTTIDVSNNDSTHTSRLGSVMKIGIGAVTGDSKYFLMSDATRKDWKIDESDCLPVLTRSAHVRKNLLEVVSKL